MKKFTAEEIIEIISNEKQIWQNVCNRLCDDEYATDEEKEIYQTLCKARVTALDELEFNFHSNKKK